MLCILVLMDVAGSAAVRAGPTGWGSRGVGSTAHSEAVSRQQRVAGGASVSVRWASVRAGPQCPAGPRAGPGRSCLFSLPWQRAVALRQVSLPLRFVSGA